MSIHFYVVFSALLGFCSSTYVFKKTQRKTLEHKAMFWLDLLFVGAFIYGLVCIFLGVDVVLPEWLILAILVPLNLYVGIIAVHYRNKEIEHIAQGYSQEEEKKCHKPLRG